MPGDLIEEHHHDGDSENDKKSNLAALHRHCHDTVHGQGPIKPTESIHDKDWPFEEPYERESLTYGSEDQHVGRPTC